jgi:hypothetical protein
MAIDKLKWHAGANNFPAGLPARNGATHMGMFLDWAMSRGLTNNQRLRELSRVGAWLLRHHRISGRAFILWFSDGVLDSLEHLNDEGHAFAESHYDRYVEEFGNVFAREYSTSYHVPYTQANRSRVFALLDERLSAWRSSDAAKTNGPS